MPSAAHAAHHPHSQLAAVTQAAQGLVAVSEISAREAAAARQQYQELDAQVQHSLIALVHSWIHNQLCLF